MKTGAMVRLVQPVIQGVVLEREINKSSDKIQCKVAWKEGDDTVHSWFDEDRLELVSTDEEVAQ